MVKVTVGDLCIVDLALDGHSVLEVKVDYLSLEDVNCMEHWNIGPSNSLQALFHLFIYFLFVYLFVNRSDLFNRMFQMVLVIPLEMQSQGM